MPAGRWFLLRAAQQQAVQHHQQQAPAVLYSRLTAGRLLKPWGHERHWPSLKNVEKLQNLVFLKKFTFSWVLSQDDCVSNFIVYIVFQNRRMGPAFRYSKNVYSSSEALDPVPKKGMTDTASV